MPEWTPPPAPKVVTEPARSTDEERWLEALTVERHYGDDAMRHVADRIAAREEAGDLWGAARWREIGFRVEALIYAARLRLAGPKPPLKSN